MDTARGPLHDAAMRMDRMRLVLVGVAVAVGAVGGCNVVLGLEGYQDCPQQGPCPTADGGMGG